ncbi:hypothetical protein MED297_01355 [Reinekea sp. MED297]|uniref:Uncharacterized protein n=1 Tax=Reinekea blandensis MED297 TaxID=314283 RepID=A4BBU1_9GAMM|nr:hypothetical protein MED297_01355 [Reinekea sp. MED297] [Reinekea blandensis MED297]
MVKSLIHLNWVKKSFFPNIMVKN